MINSRPTNEGSTRFKSLRELKRQQQLQRTMCYRLLINRRILISLVTITLAALVARQVPTVEAMWFFQDPNLTNQTQVSHEATQAQPSSTINTDQQQVLNEANQQTQQSTAGGSDYAAYGSSLLSIAGIQPSSIASLLNTVGDTGFKYFNIQDQCRNRAACDLGHMLYRKLSFVHNWLIRTSVRTLTDMNNIYTQSWMEGMLGRNCTQVYVTCRQSPLEGLMNLALLQHLAS